MGTLALSRIRRGWSQTFPPECCSHVEHTLHPGGRCLESGRTTLPERGPQSPWSLAELYAPGCSSTVWNGRQWSFETVSLIHAADTQFNLMWCIYTVGSSIWCCGLRNSYVYRDNYNAHMCCAYNNEWFVTSVLHIPWNESDLVFLTCSAIFFSRVVNPGRPRVSLGGK